MANDSLQARLAVGGVALGIWLNDPEMVEVAALAGLDWFFVDLMYTSNDWSRIATLIRAGEAYGISPVFRAQSSPWLGGDARLAVDVSRLQGIGAQYIAVSYATVDDVRACLAVERDWHRKPFLPHVERSGQQEGDLWGDATVVIPVAETREALLAIDDVLTLPELRIIRIGMNDASKILSPPGAADWYTPPLWDMVSKVVAQANSQQRFVCANAGPVTSLTELKGRTERLVEHGVRMVMAQGTTLLLHLALAEIVDEIREADVEAVRTEGAPDPLTADA